MNEEVDQGSAVDVTKQIVATTKGGKSLVIYPVQSGVWKVKFTSGGELPLFLKGRFTRYEIALAAIKDYIGNEPESVVEINKFNKVPRAVKKESNKNAESRTAS